MNNARNDKPFDPFWPVALMAASIILFFIWNIVVTVRLRGGAVRLRDQQTAIVMQGVQAEERLKRMMIDLLEMSKTDPSAAAIAQKYRITFNPPTAGVPAAGPLPAPATNTVAEGPASPAEPDTAQP